MINITEDQLAKWKKYLKSNDPYLNDFQAEKGKNYENFSTKIKRFGSMLKKDSMSEDMTWFLGPDAEVLEPSTEKFPSLKYGFPAIPSGNVETSWFMLGLVNPSIKPLDTPFNDQSMIEYYRQKRDEIDFDNFPDTFHEDEILEKINIASEADPNNYHPLFMKQGTIASEFEEILGLDEETLKKTNDQKVSKKYRHHMYHSYQYFNQIVGDFISKKTELKEISKATELTFSDLPKLCNLDFNQIGICKFEYFPYRSKNIPSGVTELVTARYSTLLVINRIIEYLYNPNEVSKPIIALRSYENYWEKTLNQILKSTEFKNIFSDFPELKEIEKKYFWFFINLRKPTVTEKNLIPGDVYLKYRQIKNDKLKEIEEQTLSKDEKKKAKSNVRKQYGGDCLRAAAAGRFEKEILGHFKS